MKLLGLDTTRKKAKVYILNEEKRYVLTMDENVKHSEGLFLYLEKALFENGLKVADFDYLSAVVGPGSFTGIRVGMSVIKAFKQVINKSILSINIFEILKSHYRNSVILLDSTSMSCYYGKVKSGEIIETGVVNKDEISEKFVGSKFVILEEEKDKINIDSDNLEIVSGDMFDNYYFDEIKKKADSSVSENFEPYYLQLSQAEKNLNDK